MCSEACADRIIELLEQVEKNTRRLDVLNKAVKIIEQYEADQKHKAINRHFEKQLQSFKKSSGVPIE